MNPALPPANEPTPFAKMPPPVLIGPYPNATEPFDAALTNPIPAAKLPPPVDKIAPPDVPALPSATLPMPLAVIGPPPKPELPKAKDPLPLAVICADPPELLPPAKLLFRADTFEPSAIFPANVDVPRPRTIRSPVVVAKPKIVRPVVVAPPPIVELAYAVNPFVNAGV